jgi:hypothetical protein
VARAVRYLALEAHSDLSDRQNHISTLDHPKGVRDKFGDRLTDRFLQLCHTEHYDDLPGIYHEWSARPEGLLDSYGLLRQPGPM